MVDWQITTTTIYCDAVDDEATVLVHADGTVKCTGYERYSHPDRNTEKLLKEKGKKLNRILGCEGLECSRVISYRNQLFCKDGK